MIVVPIQWLKGALIMGKIIEIKRLNIDPQIKCAHNGYQDQAIGIMIIQQKIYPAVVSPWSRSFDIDIHSWHFCVRYHHDPDCLISISNSSACGFRRKIKFSNFDRSQHFDWVKKQFGLYWTQTNKPSDRLAKHTFLTKKFKLILIQVDWAFTSWSI